LMRLPLLLLISVCPSSSSSHIRALIGPSSAVRVRTDPLLSWILAILAMGFRRHKQVHRSICRAPRLNSYSYIYSRSGS
jgi:hypothetical protein